VLTNGESRIDKEKGVTEKEKLKLTLKMASIPLMRAESLFPNQLLKILPFYSAIILTQSQHEFYRKQTFKPYIYGTETCTC
jgi:hypothetical protein